VLTLRRKRTDFEVIRANCVACGRCFEFCPKERANWSAPQIAVGTEKT
jgi:formate hydrogenlyase subunit 6/NADH:ubiquinone oxidoreductase subunit I